MTPLLLLLLAQPLNLNTQPIEVRQGGVKVPSKVRQYAVDCGTNVTCGVDGGVWYLSATAGGGGGGAPTTATYITQTADGTLTNEQALSSLSTGLLKVTTGTGILSTASAGVDYQAAGSYQPAGTYSGAGACAANTWASTLNGSAAPTCTQPAFSNLSGTAAGTQGGLGVAQPTCGGGQFLTCNGTSCSCGTPAGGGGGGNWSTFSISFGSDAGLSTTDSQTLTVSAAWVTGTSNVLFAGACSQSSGGVTPEECLLVAPVCSVVAQTASTSFDVACTSLVGGFGGYVVSYTGL